MERRLEEWRRTAGRRLHLGEGGRIFGVKLVAGQWVAKEAIL